MLATCIAGLAACCTLLVPAAALHAQESYRIEGRVVDATTQRPLASVQITLEGTQQGTLSDANGNYVLAARVPAGSYTLRYMFLGREAVTRQVTLGTQLTVAVEAVALRESAVALDEIVVTGVGAPTQRRALGNAVTTVSGDLVAQAKATSIDAALAGKVPGAQIMSNSGTPGGGVSVRLRGTSSIVGGAEPLYIVDGVIIDNSSTQQINFGYRTNPSNRLADLNPADIESIEILKGAAAAALYGSRANNGVIQIFTKRGAPGSTRINVSTRATLGQLERHLPFNREPALDAQGRPMPVYDHEALLFRDAWGNQTDVSVSGGADQTRFYLSAGYAHDEGIMRGASHKKLSTRLNLDQTLGTWLTVSGGANYIRSHSDLVINGENGTGGLLTALVFTPTHFNLAEKVPGTNEYVLRRAGSFPNPLEVIDFWDTPQDVSRFVGSFQARATPFTGASLEYRLGYDRYIMETSLFIPRTTPVIAPTGSSTAVTRNQYLVNNDVVGNYTWTAGAMQLTSTVGMNHTSSNERTITAGSTDLPPVTKLVRGAVQNATQNQFETATLGFFGQQTVGFSDRLFLTGALRWDASSTFGEDERWQLYPKVSASWVLSDEPFIANSSVGGFFDNLRVRAALGFAGNQPPVGSAYARFPRYGAITNINRLGLVHLANPGNPSLKPERQREWEAGLDASFLDDRFGIAFTYYDQYVTDLLLSRPFAPSTGYGSVLDNVGELSNKGIELQLTSRQVDRAALGWSTILNFSLNRNKVVKLAGAPFTEPYNNRVTEGEPLGVWWLFDFQRDDNGGILHDANGLPLRATTQTIMGDPNPDFQASLRNDFRIGGNLTASVLLDGVFGHDVWNQTVRIMDQFKAGPLWEREARGEFPTNYTARYIAATGAYLEDGTFVKIRELSITYDIPATFTDRIGLSSAAIELGGRNLHTFTDYRGYDPETNMFGTSTVSRGTDFATYPNPRVWTFGVRASY
jgi:TonB-linked SusC/RagA family outer membrane protein